jgi:hypothetical protein
LVIAKSKATQIPVECSDATVILLHTKDTSMILIFNYASRNAANVAENEETLKARMQSITKAGKKAEEETQRPLELHVCADWNRYHDFWGGPEAQSQKSLLQEEEQIVNFLHGLSLQSLLQTGILM